MSKNDGKRKERKAVIEKYLGGLFARTEGYARNVSRYYTAAVEALLDLAATADMEPDEVFHFSDHKRMSVKATNILRGLYSAIYQEIRRGVKAEWEYANLSADAMITSLFGKGIAADNSFARWFARNQEAIDSFFSRKDSHGGLNLSQKVWKYTGQFKEEMELALSASLGQGDSAATVSRHVRQYLREPDRLFRRVRDAQGNLKLSKRAAAYHPGRGEYRSSYKNAMRLTRTETNMAYRAADCDRWSRIPFVVGMEVKRSNHPFGCEVCEALKGKYPKDFVFTGWHPQCRCFIVPVLASEEERMAYHRAVLNGEDVSDFHFKGEITEPHEGFRKWIGENQERIEGARRLPYWMRDNGRYVGAATSSQHTEQGVRDIHDQRDTASAERIKNKQGVRDTMDMSGFNVANTFPNGGKILIHELVSSKDSDYTKLIDVATFFAAMGKEVRLTPKMKRPPQFEYASIYGSLVGTRYVNKCPDMLVDDFWYEHEGFISSNPKNAFRNMLNDGLIQASRLVIDKPNLTEAYMKRVIRQRIKDGQMIDEIWVKDGISIQLIYKKFEE